MTSLTTEFYVTGGTLRRDAACYVVRQADRELLAGLRQGKFCYVLTSRQMGKSSLMVRAAAQLREEGCGVVILDLTAIGQNLSAEQWYRGLLDQMGYQLELEDELIEFWRENKELGAIQRWMRAIHEVMLPRYPGPVVIFIDEIDAVRSLPFSTDEFFAAIREVYNRRTEDEELERLTFCLLGVAVPSDLIRDTRTTPFNIGSRAELHDFTEAEAASLAQGLNCEEQLATTLLKRIHYWTNGHPYLTQRLCQSIAEATPHSAFRIPHSVDRLCEEMFFTPRAQERDDNLLFVRERLLRSEVDLAGLLHLYEQVQRRKRVRDDEANPVVSALCLSGIVRVENGRLRHRNRIYARVFDREWVKTNMPDVELRRQRAAFRRGLLRATTVAAVIVAVMAALTWLVLQQRNRAIEQQIVNRGLLYAAHMKLAQQAWDMRDIERMERLLFTYLPGSGEDDRRGFEWYYLWRLYQSYSSVRHEGEVSSVAFSPDGNVLATGSLDRTVRLWEVTTRRNLAILQHPQRVQSVTFSSDGKTLATGGSDGIVRLWDLPTRKEKASFKAHAATIWCVTYSPDNKKIASASLDHSVKLWDAATGRELITLKAKKGEEFKGDFGSVAFSPDGSSLVARGPGIVTVWDIQGRELTTFKGCGGATRSVSFSPDGKTLVMINKDNSLRLYKVGNWQELVTLKGHQAEVWSIAFSPDGRRLASGGGDRNVKLWEVATGRELATLTGHAAAVSGVAFSPDGKRLASGSLDWTVKLWDLAQEREMSVLEGGTDHIWSLAFSPDGQKLASGGEGQVIKLWEVATGRELGALIGHAGTVRSVTFSPDGRWLASGSDDYMVKLWEVATGREIANCSGHTESVQAALFFPDGKRLLSYGRDMANLWELTTVREPVLLEGQYKCHLVGTAISSDGKKLAASGYDRLWGAAISPDGKKIALSGYDKAVVLIDATTRRVITILKGHAGAVGPVAFSFDSQKLASGSYDKTVKIWEVATGRELATIQGHGASITSVAFSPDGRRLVTGSTDATARIWDLATGQELLNLRGHMDTVRAAISSDGNTIATASEDSTIRLWRTATN